LFGARKWQKSLTKMCSTCHSFQLSDGECEYMVSSVCMEKNKNLKS